MRNDIPAAIQVGLYASYAAATLPSFALMRSGGVHTVVGLAAILFTLALAFTHLRRTRESTAQGRVRVRGIAIFVLLILALGAGARLSVLELLAIDTLAFISLGAVAAAVILLRIDRVKNAVPELNHD